MIIDLTDEQTSFLMSYVPTGGDDFEYILSGLNLQHKSYVELSDMLETVKVFYQCLSSNSVDYESTLRYIKASQYVYDAIECK